MWGERREEHSRALMPVSAPVVCSRATPVLRVGWFALEASLDVCSCGPTAVRYGRVGGRMELRGVLVLCCTL
jgi:hypothetical protein